MLVKAVKRARDSGDKKPGCTCCACSAKQLDILI